MWIYYAMILAAAGLFATQFLFQQKFYEKQGNTTGSSMDFSAGCQVAGILFFLILCRFRVQVSAFSLWVALLNAFNGLLYAYVSMKALSSVNLVGYSMFAMLGGMIIPFWYGIFFEHEPITFTKILCTLLITIALFMSMSGKGKIRKGIFFYFAVFFLNGMSGVWSILHQSNLEERIDSISFSLWGSIFGLIMGVLFLFVKEKRLPKFQKAGIPWVTGHAIVNSIGALFLLVALNELPASVQYPVVTGGTMIFTAFISGIRKEKLTRADLVGTGIALLATIVIVL